MKTNLDSMFKMNTDLEKDGVWFEFKEGISFKLKRFGGENAPALKESMAKHYKPYANLVAVDALPMRKEKEIMAKVFVDACLVEWKGIIDTERGEEIPYSFDNAVELLMELPELADTLTKFASETDSYRESLGNS